MDNLVTIIIPSYNHSRFIGYTIESIISQSYQNIELIIIDDGSTDNSIEIINNFKNICTQRFRKFIFINRENKGLCYTLNEGIKLSSGKYISIIASDDIMHHDKTTEQVDYLEHNSECVGVFSGADIIKENGALLSSKNGTNVKYYFNDIILNQYQLFSPSAMYRLENMIKTGLYPTDIILEDWYMNLKITEKSGYLISLKKPLISYRRHSSNTSLQTTRLHSDRQKILKLFENNILYKKANLELTYTIAYESVSFNKTRSVTYLLNSLLKNPFILFRRLTMVTIVKLFLPKKILNRRLTGK